jgi:transcriptional regulator with XRE-family HTH domain
MIKNERQYRITKAQADRFENALAEMSSSHKSKEAVHPLIEKAQREAVMSQLDDLNAQISAYDALRSGKQFVLARESFEDLPSALIQARIAAGLSQKDLAERLHLKEQQIQRYEATEYASASLERMRDVVRALGLSIRGDVFLPTANISPDTFLKRLAEAGFRREFVLKRLLPHSLAARLQNGGGNSEGLDKYVLQAATIVSRVLHCSVADFFKPGPLELNAFPALAAARFKLPATAKASRVKAYTVYAHYLALLALMATQDLPHREIPSDPDEFRKEVLSSFGTLSFSNLLEYAWSIGIVVLPLGDAGTFHGACWRISGRNIMVLKQQTASVARWCFDFLHESRHLAEDPGVDELCVVEFSENSEERRKSEEERVCSEFASNVLLEGRAEKLVDLCVEASNGKVELLSAVLPRIAKKEKVSVGALANHMAYRLWQDEVTDWWGPATNLQEPNPSPWGVARDLFLKYANFDRLNEMDRTLLQQALQNS